ncbi:hypothetical protein [Paenibacillus silvisoli]|uniref:hypothetical protein n=1 Tax=Paenibacillus silvisoli TaxID=3110539 RepID=UPI0028044DEA|nr:hypothetical protein [Paenibacillus silvisoli]
MNAPKSSEVVPVERYIRVNTPKSSEVVPVERYIRVNTPKSSERAPGKLLTVVRAAISRK